MNNLWLRRLVGVISLFAAMPCAPAGVDHLPNERCKLKVSDEASAWSEQERWVFAQVCAGEEADLAKKYGACSDPSRDNCWPAKTLLTPRFVETILLSDSFRGAIRGRGVRITGAHFRETLDLSRAVLQHELWLDRVGFDQDLLLSGLQTSKRLSLDGSFVRRNLDMRRVQVANDLKMSDGSFSDVDLSAGKVGGQLVLNGSVVKRKLNMDNLEVAAGLYMARGEYAEINLSAAKIGGQLDLEGSTVREELNLANVSVGKSLFLRSITLLGKKKTSLIYSSIGGNLDLSADWLRPEEHPDAKPTTTTKPSGNQLNTLDLTGAKISQGLRLGSSERRPPWWQPEASLILRNATVREMQDRADDCAPNKISCGDPWPRQLDLTGFTFENFGVLDVDDRSNMEGREASWWVNWLLRQPKFSPEPYQQLAAVLQKLGQKQKAEDVLYAAKERELSVTPYPEKAWLFLHKVLIGYGHRIYYAIYWVLGFVAAGALIMRFTGEGPRNGMPYGLAFSFDMLLPIVKLRESHYKIDFTGWGRYYFYLHKLMGYVLASFLIAGLSGLTR